MLLIHHSNTNLHFLKLRYNTFPIIFANNRFSEASETESKEPAPEDEKEEPEKSSTDEDEKEKVEEKKKVWMKFSNILLIFLKIFTNATTTSAEID